MTVKHMNETEKRNNLNSNLNNNNHTLAMVRYTLVRRTVIFYVARTTKL